MSVDTEAISAAIVAVEAVIHPRGWDKNAELHLVYPHADGLRSFPVVTDWPTGRGADTLAALSYSMESKAGTPLGAHMIRTIQDAVGARGYLAALYVAEGYINTNPDGIDNGGRGLADRVDSRECRTVIGCDCDGNAYMYVRVRGQQPEPVQVFGFDPEEGVVGTIPEALARILTFVTGQPVATQTLPDWLRKPSS